MEHGGYYGEEGEQQQQPPLQGQGQQQGETQGNEQQQQQGQGQQQHVYYHPLMAQGAPEVYGYSMEQAWAQQQQQQAAMMYPPGAYDYRYQYPLLQHMEGVPLPPGIPGLGGSTDPLEAVLGPFPCVRLRNLPYDPTLEDILVFFQGLVLIDVVLVGQGEAFALFSNPMDFQMALQRNRQTIGRRFVEISAASRSDYYEAVAALHEQERGTQPGAASSAIGAGGSGGGGAASGAATLRQRTDSGGLARGDEPQHSGGESSAASSVAGLWNPGGEATSVHGVHGLGSGTASPLDAASFESSIASQSHASTTPGLFPMSGGAGGGSMIGRGGPPQQRGALHAPLQKRTGGGIQVGEHTGFLRMRGLPFSATKEDITKFFVGYNPVPESVVLTYRNDGRATGEAYVGFASPDDAKRAMELHRRSMGNRYIELFISNKDEQGRALTRFGNR